ncbi:MAG TPA: SbcC/MukB-like Walker B domain-containing protein, partial [Opitutaceae bacterium]|nr:SbcC/MukB-like Walker B domain-containing protein [Opitutaceae bacterium]
VEQLRSRERSLDLAIQANAVHQHIERLELQIKEQDRLRIERHKQFESLQQTLRSVGESYVLSDAAGFNESLKRWQNRLSALEGELEDLRVRKIELSQRGNQLAADNQRAEADLKLMGAQTSNIDPQWLRVRLRICEATGHAPEQLPFAGELIEVRAEDAAWRGALERLLRPFALALLVPDTPAVYGKVVPFIKSTHLGLRLVFYKVPALSGVRLSFENDRRRAWGKLRVKDDHPLQAWLAREVRAQFDHLCCDTSAEFEAAPRALTKDGLIAHSEHRREKDDRRPVGDDFMLGWSNREKLQSMAQAIKLRAKDIEAANIAIRSAKQTMDKKQPVAQALGIVTATATFERIDHATPAALILDLTRQKEKLEQSNKAYQDMKRDLEKVRGDLKTSEENKRGKEAEVTRLATSLEGLAEQRQRKEELLAGDALALVEGHAELLAQQLGGNEITGRNADVQEKGLADKIDGTVSRRSGEVTKSRNRILELMGTFQQKAHDPNLEIKIEALKDFRDLLTRLTKDDLPVHRKRFNELMEKKVVYDAGKLSSELRDYSNFIEDRVKLLNVALASIPYTEGTYVQLRYQATRNDEIVAFRKRLREATERATNWDDAQRTEAFNRINSLLKDFDANPEWRQRVTDVRNWWEFSASERNRINQEEVRPYWDSAGLSPGQKTKLAYTFLVAGLVFQYGLSRDNPKSRTFRFVMVDEIFKGVDKENAIYAMRLFREFGLQLLLVNPWNDEIMMIERQGFVASYHLVTNKDMCDSQLHTIQRAELLQRLEKQFPAKISPHARAG